MDMHGVSLPTSDGAESVLGTLRWANSGIRVDAATAADGSSSWWDSVEQWVTSAPIWFQAPIVFVVAIPVCLALAWVVLKAVDRVGMRIEKLIFQTRSHETSKSTVRNSPQRVDLKSQHHSPGFQRRERQN